MNSPTKLFVLFFAFMTFVQVVEQKDWHTFSMPSWTLRVYNMSKYDFHACFKLDEYETICANSSDKHVVISNGDGKVFFHLRYAPNYEYRRIGDIALVKFKGEKKEWRLLANNLIFDSKEEVPNSYLTELGENELYKQAKELMMKGSVDAMAPLADAIDDLPLGEEEQKAVRPVLALAMNVLKTQANLIASGDLIRGKPKYLDRRIVRQKRYAECPEGRQPLEPECLGMCGPGCSCWKSVCGDCCFQQGCYDHDICCREKAMSSNCISPLKLLFEFSCASYAEHCT